MNDRLTQLFDQHNDLSDRLFALRHRQYLAELPKDFVSFKQPGPQKLYLNQAEKRLLDLEILQIQMRILKLAQEIHASRFSDVPAWIIAGIDRLHRDIEVTVWNE